VKNKDGQRMFLLVNAFMSLFLLVSTVVFWRTNLDVSLISRFYSESDGWVGPNHPVLSFFYFPMNAILFGVPLLIGFPLFLLSFSQSPFFVRVRRFRRHALLFVCAPLFGVGIVNSIVLKGFFARPRPVLFFSEEIYYRPLEIAFSYWGDVDASFPSGHVSMGVVWVMFYFAFREAKTPLAASLKWGLGVVFPLIVGAIMSVSRMAYGEHYLSDGIWAAAFTYVVVLGFTHLLGIPEANLKHANTDKHPRSRPTLRDLAFLVLAVALPALFLALLFVSFNGLTTI